TPAINTRVCRLATTCARACSMIWRFPTGMDKSLSQNGDRTLRCEESCPRFGRGAKPFPERKDTMVPPQVAPYGSWKSPITSDLIVSGTMGLEQVILDGADIYWIEARPAEGGRNVIVRRTPGGRTADVTPAPLNARTRVHEYGGGAYTV